MKLSIIIPAYNVGQYIGKCLNSVYEESTVMDDFEVIVVDDGSTDNTLEVANGYKASHANLKVIHKNNEGVGSARNVGLDEAQGEYVTFVDDDDWIVGRGNLLVNSIIKHKRADGIAFRFYLDDRKTRFHRRRNKCSLG